MRGHILRFSTQFRSGFQQLRTNSRRNRGENLPKRLISTSKSHQLLVCHDPPSTLLVHGS